MNDALYLGAFGGALVTFFIVSLTMARVLKEKKFYLLNVFIAGIGLFFLVDKKALAHLVGFPETETWLATGACPLLIGMMALAMVLRTVTDMRESAPAIDKIATLFTAFLGAGLIVALIPVGANLAGQAAFSQFLDAKILPNGFAAVTTLGVIGWMITLMAPVLIGEWRLISALGVLFAAGGLLIYNLILKGIVPFNEAAVNGIRVCMTAASGCFILYVYRHKRAATVRKEQDSAKGRNRSHEREENQRFREATAQAHMMRVLRREKELEAELRKREGERMEALQQAKDAADEMTRNKTHFLAFMSHEIRTPLNGIMGMVRLLMTTSLSEQQKDYIQTLNYSGDALLALVNDTLDLSKIEAGQLTLENIDFDLQRLVSSIIMLMSARASEKGLLVRSDIGNAVPQFIKGDPTRLRQILLNLINNSIKFTEEGGVTVAVHLLPGAPDSLYRLRFEVQDTGVGIPEAARDRLFKEYSQVDASTTRLYGGTGLGLSICKQLVTAMQGEIGVDSLEGQGSTFWFVVDFGTAESGDTLGEIVESENGPQLSAMVIEDNEIHQKVIGGYLKLFGHDVTMVSSAEEALDLFGVNDYDVLLMDVNLPGLNGNDATKRIRQMADPLKRSVPIIAITGNTSPPDIDECRLSGMNDFVGKPVDPEALRSAIISTHKIWIETRHQQPSPKPEPAETAAPIQRPLNILVVDDNEINQKVVSGYLEIGHHHVDKAKDGEKAVTQAAAKLYDLILMDIQLPGIDGLEASRRIRALEDPVKRNVPIVALTGNTGQEDIDQCREAGMNDFLPKPVDLDSLMALIARVKLPNTDPLDDYLPHDTNPEMLLDEAVLSRLTKAFDQKALTGLLEEMLRESEPMIAEMQAAAKTQDLTALKSAAHTLKGMAMTLGSIGLGERAANIETGIQRGEPSSKLAIMVDELEDSLERSRDAIEQWLNRNGRQVA